jgi:hypothetical protein
MINCIKLTRPSKERTRKEKLKEIVKQFNESKKHPRLIKTPKKMSMITIWHLKKQCPRNN